MYYMQVSNISGSTLRYPLMQNRIRRIKCDEERPSCLKCVSTGRCCDGYVDEEGKKSDSDITPAATTPDTAPNAECTTPSNTVYAGDADLHLWSNEPTNAVSTDLQILSFPRIPSNHLPGPAFGYFLHRSSLDLTGPLHAHVWNSYVLSICATSPAIQHAITAFSGFHRLFSLPESKQIDDRESWKQYFLASEAIRALVGKITSGHERDVDGKEEILVACAMFGNLELLLGNMNAASKHLDSGLAVIRQSLSTITTRKAVESCPDIEPQTLLDSRVIGLMEHFGQLDLQVLTFLPSQHISTPNPLLAPAYRILQVTQPSTDSLTSQVYRMVKHSLYWIRHFARPHRYSTVQPPSLRSARDKLLSDLETWRFALQAYQGEPSSSQTKIVNLLVASHLAALQLRSSLSPHESGFDTAQNLSSFRAIIKYCRAMLATPGPRPNAALDPESYVPANGEVQHHAVELFLLLEDCTAEALYYTALKCRDPQLRREAMFFLSGIESARVWDGPMMAKVADFVIGLEERGMNPGERGIEAVREYYEARVGRMYSIWTGEKREHVWPREENRVKTVEVDVNWEYRRVHVKCHLLGEDGLWRTESACLNGESTATF